MKGCKDLKGKTVAADGINNARYLYIGAAVATCGLKISDMKLIDLANAPLVKAGIAGQIHIGVFHIDELAQVEYKTGKKWHNIDVPPAIKKSLHYLMLIASKKAIAENREGVVRFLEGWIKAAELMGSNKPADKEQFAKIAANASQIDPKVALAAIDSYHAINYWENNNGLDKNQIMAQLNELVQIGSVKPEKKPSYEKIVDTLALRRGGQARREEVKRRHVARTGSGKSRARRGIARRARRTASGRSMPGGSRSPATR